MTVTKILYVPAVFMLCSIVQASEYYKGYDVNQPRVPRQQTQRALDYEHAYNKNALGFRPAVQQRPRIAEYEAAFATQNPVQDFAIVKKENYLGGQFGIDQLSAKAADKTIGEITYSPSKCWINHLGVDLEQRKRGLGSKLFKSAVNEMKDCEKIRWWATPNSVPFYRKQGAQKDYYQETGSYLNMILDKTPPELRIKRNFQDRPF